MEERKVLLNCITTDKHFKNYTQIMKVITIDVETKSAFHSKGILGRWYNKEDYHYEEIEKDRKKLGEMFEYLQAQVRSCDEAINVLKKEFDGTKDAVRQEKMAEKMSFLAGKMSAFCDITNWYKDN